MSGSPPPAVVVQRVSKVYGATRALDRVSLAVPAGQFVAVIGRSGAGKTTLLRCLSRAVLPSEGAIRFADRDVIALRGRGLRAHRTRVGMIYQQFNLVRRLRVMDNVLIGRVPHLTGAWRWAALARCFAAPERDIAARALDHVGLLDRAWQRVDTLSGGQQQRVAIARALAQAPEVILADEPVASLDLASGTSVMETLRLCAGAAGLTVIATLHHVEYARRFADRIVGQYCIPGRERRPGGWGGGSPWTHASGDAISLTDVFSARASADTPLPAPASRESPRPARPAPPVERTKPPGRRGPSEGFTE